MIKRGTISKIFHPTPSVDKLDTRLRYTDVLFGFVIRELFIRIRYWEGLSPVVRAQLVAGTALVLGSWVGYRRSLNRSSYDVKFFNLPFFQFLADQGMLILYFHIATLTPADGSSPSSAPESIASQTARIVIWVFVLYLMWDFVALWSTWANLADGTPRYPGLNADKSPTSDRKRADWKGFFITLFFLYLAWIAWDLTASGPPVRGLYTVAGLLVLYRWLKEVRSTWR